MAPLGGDRAYPKYIDERRNYPIHWDAFQEWCTGEMPSSQAQLDRYIAMLAFIRDEQERIGDALEYFHAVKVLTMDEKSGVTLESFIALSDHERDACLRVHAEQEVLLGDLARIRGEVGENIRQLALEKMQPPVTEVTQ